MKNILAFLEAVNQMNPTTLSLLLSFVAVGVAGLSVYMMGAN
ncbi:MULTISPECIES: hypothetical protein [unclassified Pseudovibrio]|nr:MULTISPECIES: hypothetical protein [unclassified Pseudovibrio]KZK96627.1 hypothetical protein PsW74_03856 [Pseudovibrio sp. W74]KZL03216.1 hypothetical protein PsAD14_05746 [Pseudovibrio sp. Ad14]